MFHNVVVTLADGSVEYVLVSRDEAVYVRDQVRAGAYWALESVSSVHTEEFCVKHDSWQKATEWGQCELCYAEDVALRE